MKIGLGLAKSKISNSLQVVMAQLAEQFLPTPETSSSSPAYGLFNTFISLSIA